MSGRDGGQRLVCVDCVCVFAMCSVSVWRMQGHHTQRATSVHTRAENSTHREVVSCVKRCTDHSAMNSGDGMCLDGHELRRRRKSVS